MFKFILVKMTGNSQLLYSCHVPFCCSSFPCSDYSHCWILCVFNLKICCVPVTWSVSGLFQWVMSSHGVMEHCLNCDGMFLSFFFSLPSLACSKQLCSWWFPWEEIWECRSVMDRNSSSFMIAHVYSISLVTDMVSFNFFWALFILS